MTNQPRSILIVRLSAIGDVIHALPLLEVLRANFPEARIGWLVEELSAQLLRGHPDLDELYVIPKKRWRGQYHKKYWSEIRPFFREIREAGWDAAVDVQGIFKSGLAAWRSGAGIRAGFAGENSREANGLFINRRTRPAASDIHVVQQNVRVLEGLGIDVPDTPPAALLPVSEQEQASIRNQLGDLGWNQEPLLGLNAGAGFPSKQWAPERYAELARRISEDYHLRPLVLWGPKEEELRDVMARDLKDLGAIVAPDTNLRELAALIGQCRLLISGDTGPAQMAGPLGVPVLTIFGATDARRNSPWDGGRGTSFTVQREDLWCVPCKKRRCPLEGEQFMACLRGLHPDFVYNEAREWLDALSS